MPSFDNTSDEAYDTVSQVPIFQMNHDECDVEKLRIRTRMDYLENEIVISMESGMDSDSNAIQSLQRRIGNLSSRFREVGNQMIALDAQDRAMAAQNAGNGSSSRGRSSQSPPAPRAPHSSPQR